MKGDGDQSVLSRFFNGGGAMLSANKEQMLILRPLRVATAIALAFWAVGRSSAQDISLLEPNPRPLIPLLQVLDDANLSGSLQISGVCESKRFPKFPEIGEKKSDSALTTIGEMLSRNTGLTVSQDSNGIIRIVGPDVPTDFLKVRIRHIAFEDDKHNRIFSPNLAMVYLLETTEVRAFFKRKGIPNFMPVFMGSGGMINGRPYWPPDSPNISGTLDNVTVEEVLDHILQTFSGVWFYGNCVRDENHKRAIYLRFYRLLKNYNRDRVTAGM